jgi:hypothetical protein
MGVQSSTGVVWLVIISVLVPGKILELLFRVIVTWQMVHPKEALPLS